MGNVIELSRIREHSPQAGTPETSFKGVKTFRVESEGPVLHTRISGRVSYGELVNGAYHLFMKWDMRCQPLVLDLSRLIHCDRDGLAHLAGTVSDAIHCGATVYLVCGPRFLRSLGFDQWSLPSLHVVRTAGEALDEILGEDRERDKPCETLKNPRVRLSAKPTFTMSSSIIVGHGKVSRE